MELTIIGYQGGYPTIQSGTSCYLIKDDNINIVLDMGAGTLRDLQRYIDLKDIDSIIISHFHPDHYSDLMCFQQGYLIKKQLGEKLKPITIYCLNDDKYLEVLKNDYGIDIKIIDDKTCIKIGEMEIDFIKTVHSAKGLSVRIKKDNKFLVYTADTELHDELINFSKYADLILAECSLYHENPEIKGHMYPGAVKKLIEKSMCIKAILVHLPVYKDTNELLNQFGEYKDSVDLAYKGFKIKI